MTISLQKGEVVALKEKNGSTLKSIKVCLGWDPKKNKGFFSSLFNRSEFDLDASAFLLNDDNINEIIYYGHLKNANSSVTHSGDNLTGEGKILDKEQIHINLNELPNDINTIVFTVNIYMANERNQHFGKVENSFIRIENKTDKKEFCRYELSGKGFDNYKSMIFGLLKKVDDEWKFKACGEGSCYGSTIPELKGIVSNYIKKNN